MRAARRKADSSRAGDGAMAGSLRRGRLRVCQPGPTRRAAQRVVGPHGSLRYERTTDAGRRPGPGTPLRARHRGHGIHRDPVGSRAACPGTSRARPDPRPEQARATGLARPGRRRRGRRHGPRHARTRTVRDVDRLLPAPLDGRQAGLRAAGPGDRPPLRPGGPRGRGAPDRLSQAESPPPCCRRRSSSARGRPLSR